MFHGSSRKRDPKELCKYDLVVTTYQTLASDFGTGDGSDAPCGKVEWERVICDESHTLKNVKAKLTQACLALRGARVRACLCAAPAAPGCGAARQGVNWLLSGSCFFAQG